MRMPEEDRQKILQMYIDGRPKLEIAEATNHAKKTVYIIIREAVAAGEVPDGIIAERSRDECKAKYEKVCTEYAQGTKLKDICKKFGMSANSVSLYIKKGKDNGLLKDRYTERREERKKAEFIKRDEKYSFAESTLESGKTVRCTPSVASKCVYGWDNVSAGLCRYSRITGKCRSLICSHEACTCFSEVSKTNPRLSPKGEE